MRNFFLNFLRQKYVDMFTAIVTYRYHVVSVSENKHETS